MVVHRNEINNAKTKKLQKIIPEISFIKKQSLAQEKFKMFQETESVLKKKRKDILVQLMLKENYAEFHNRIMFLDKACFNLALILNISNH